MSKDELPCSICGELLSTEKEAVQHMKDEHDFPGDGVVFIE